MLPESAALKASMRPEDQTVPAESGQPAVVPGVGNIVSCDSEPIHLIGAIQPMGFLITVNADWVVVRASDNVGQFLPARHADVIGRKLRDLLPASLLHDIRGRLQASGAADGVDHLFGQQLEEGGRPFSVAAHQSGSELVLEFEPAPAEAPPETDLLRGMLARIGRHATLPALFRETARQLRALTGFDRVMVYRFNSDGNGEVVGEAARGGLTPYLGLRYPASDIPAQARALYARNLLRGIADIDVAPVPVSPVTSPEGHTLDLSLSVLRAVSPIHVEYLRNMGVRASMSVSLLKDGALWGLIACHHFQPRHVPLPTRSVLELFAQLFSHVLQIRIGAEEAAYEARARDVHHRIMTSFAEPDSDFAAVAEFLFAAADYIPADGIGAYYAGKVSLTGLTPTREEFVQLVRFLNKTAAGRVFATDCLSDAFPPAADYVARAAGILSVPISRVPRDYLVFFRREMVSSVTWAGEPTKAETLGPNGVRLTPRKSFEAWREIVQFHGAPWAARELRAAEALRVTLLEVVLRLSDAAQSERIGHQHRQELLVAELNHRVRNILGLVRGLIGQSAATATDMKDLVASLEERIAALARAHDLLTRVNWSPASFHGLLHAEVGAIAAEPRRLILTGPDLLLTPKAFSALAMVVHELATNARKHGALLTPQGRIEVTTGIDEVGNARIGWSESGGPPVLPPTRRGFGSVILEQALAFEINGSSRPVYQPSGFRLDIVLPAAAATPAEATPTVFIAPNATAMDASWSPPPDLPALLSVCLVVEDNLFIACDVEEMLTGLGAARVEIARSVTEATQAMAATRFSFALLDVNLGDETSVPVARALRAAGIAFAFGTGYGDAMSMDPELADVPVLAKPYEPATLRRVIVAAVSRPAAAEADGAI